MTLKTLHDDYCLINNLVFEKCKFEVKEVILENESQTYGACTFKLDKLSFIFRVAKITPTKAGLFVSIWKRNHAGVTAPIDNIDEMDFIIITARNEDNFGMFIFPKSVLADEGIITQNNNIGKRGIRVYPPWVKTLNKQAISTQSWQQKYFLTINNTTDLELAKKLFLINVAKKQ